MRGPIAHTRLRLFHLAGVLIALTAFSLPAAAQDAAPNTAAVVEVRKWYLNDLDTVHVKLIALAEAIPADKYSWRPAPGVRSIGEAFMHAASEYYTYAPAAYGAPRSPVIARTREAFKNFEATGTKDEVLKHLREGFAYTTQTVGAVDAASLTGSRKLFGGDHTVVETSFAMVDDLHEHLGQLIAYARMNGITPPWSK
jgi:hypothetical protein